MSKPLLGLMLSCRHALKYSSRCAHTSAAIECTPLGSRYLCNGRRSPIELAESLSVCRGACSVRSMSAKTATAQPINRSRIYPDEPRVGIGVVMLRKGRESGAAEVLLVRRAKPPEQGKWTVPGGSLELAETMVECAVREALEETGLRLRNDPQAAEAAEAASAGVTGGLEVPTPFAAADVIVHDNDGRLAFHYAIIEVAAIPVDPHAQLAPGGDVDGAQWKDVSACRHMPDLIKNSAKIAEEAAKRFADALK